MKEVLDTAKPYRNLQTLLGWSTVINTGVLVVWYLALIFAHDFIFKTHTWWFEISSVLMKSTTQCICTTSQR